MNTLINFCTCILAAHCIPQSTIKAVPRVLAKIFALRKSQAVSLILYKEMKKGMEIHF